MELHLSISHIPALNLQLVIWHTFLFGILYFIYQCSQAPNVYCDLTCSSCSLPPVGFVFEGSMSMELSESDRGIFRVELCTLHPFSSFLIHKHHRNSLLPPQEIICKSSWIYMASCYRSPAGWLFSVRTDKLSDCLPLLSPLCVLMWQRGVPWVEKSSVHSYLTWWGS